MKHFIFSCLVLFTLASCNKDAADFPGLWTTENAGFSTDNNKDLVAATEESNLSITLTLTDKSVVSFTADKISAAAVNDNVFTFVKEPGTLNQQSYQVTGAVVSKTENHLDVTVNPGVNAVYYYDKNSLSLSAGSAMGVVIQSGNISTTATNIVGEDNDGV
jgi:hypothetical protein